MENLVVQQDWSIVLPLEAGEQAAKLSINAADACFYVATSFLDVLCASTQDGQVRASCDGRRAQQARRHTA
jgi:hypothetical protein